MAFLLEQILRLRNPFEREGLGHQRANLPALRENWRLSGRALGLGMPLTMIGIAG